MWRVAYFLQTATIDLASAAVFLIPLFLILWKVLFKSAKLTALYTLSAFYLTAVLSIVGFPVITNIVFDSGVNVIPIAGISPAESLLNVLLFIPLGAFLPIFWEKFRSPLAAIASGFGVSLFIEAAQLLTFRLTDINDLIANTAGAAIGYFAAKLVTKGFTRLVVKNSSFRDFWVVFGSAAVIMFAAKPFISGMIRNIIDR